MRIPGRVQNGVVVLEGNATLPEGLAVSVIDRAAPLVAPVEPKKRVEFPLVRSAKPGSLNLTGDRIAEILEEDDVSS